MRIEETANLCDLVEQSIRHQIPSSEIQNVIDNIGLPSAASISLIAIRPRRLIGCRHPCDSFAKHHPRMTTFTSFGFHSQDSSRRDLRFFARRHGQPNPELRLAGSDRCPSCGKRLGGNQRYANALLSKLKYVTGTADLRIQQPFDEPYLRMRSNVRKQKSLDFGFTNMRRSFLVSLRGSFQTSPTFWVGPKDHVSYQIARRLRNIRTNTLQDIENIPVTGTRPTALHRSW